jgi:hypothetical protein
VGVGKCAKEKLHTRLPGNINPDTVLDLTLMNFLIQVLQVELEEQESLAWLFHNYLIAIKHDKWLEGTVVCTGNIISNIHREITGMNTSP